MEGVHGQPAAAPLSGDPWGNPNTDTRELLCWDAGEAADCDKVVGNLASRAPWDHDLRANAPTLTTIGNNAVTATSWAHPRTERAPVQADEPEPGLPVPVDERLVHRGTASRRREPRGRPGTTRQRYEPVRRAQPDARLGVLPRFTERNWNAQDINFGLTETWRENDPVVGDAQAGVLAGARDNANMSPCPTVDGVHEHVHVAAAAGAFYAPCVDGDFDMA